MFRIVSTTCESSRELQGSRASTGIASADIVMRGLHKLRPRHLMGDERQEVVEPLRRLPVSRFAPVQVSGVAERKGFEPLIQLSPYGALAKRCLQPLGHLSGAGLMP